MLIFHFRSGQFWPVIWPVNIAICFNRFLNRLDVPNALGRHTATIHRRWEILWPLHAPQCQLTSVHFLHPHPAVTALYTYAIQRLLLWRSIPGGSFFCAFWLQNGDFPYALGIDVQTCSKVFFGKSFLGWNRSWHEYRTVEKICENVLAHQNVFVYCKFSVFFKCAGELTGYLTG